MRVAIAYPPLKSEKGVPLLTQNRQFQWFSRTTYIFPVIPATAATRVKRAGHEVLFLDGIAAGLTEEDFLEKLNGFNPDVVVIETKTPVVKRHWHVPVCRLKRYYSQSAQTVSHLCRVARISAEPLRDIW